jgi:GNAT superfamily N-acetyltransferase
VAAVAADPGELTFVSLRDRPDLAGAFWDVENTWPLFMQQDPIGGVFFGRSAEVFPDCHLLALDPSGTAIGRINAVPFAWKGIEALPAAGWDAIQETAHSEHAEGIAPTAVSLTEARIVSRWLGHGLSSRLLSAARDHVRTLGIAHLVGPVRPTAKSLEPLTPMGEYVRRVRDDGLPYDPWLRVHVRLGATIEAVCPTAMTIPGTLAQWREWTGLPFDRSGTLLLDGALTPVHVSVEQDHAVYVEPNVWVHHDLG